MTIQWNEEKIAKLKKFDMADYLTTADDVLEYLEEAKKLGTTEFVRSLSVVARSQGMTKLAGVTGLKRESLYKIFQAKGSPKFDTIEKILSAFGYKLDIVKIPEQDITTPQELVNA